MQVDDWQELLERLALAHWMEEDGQLAQPVLTEGKTRLEGGVPISEYLLQLEEESGQWWYCGC